MKEKIKRLFEKSLPGGNIQGVDKLAGDASTREYYRIKTDTQNYIACLESLEKKMQSNENFITIGEIFKDHNIRIPAVYHYQLSEGYILQEDLGDQTLQARMGKSKTNAEELEDYKKAVNELIKIHHIDVTKYSHPSFSLAFDTNKLMEEVAFTSSHLIEALMGHKLSKQENKVLHSSYLKICQAISAQRRVCTHRDYHSRNLIIKKGLVHVIDFQDARMGLPQYDLTSLLDDCYYNLSSKNKAQLKKYYHKESKMPESHDHFEHLYHYTKLQRVFKALGSFGYIYMQKQDERYFKYIDNGFKKLQESLELLKEFHDLQDVLQRFHEC